ncbi:DUF6221 family protein [Streptomyces sp. NPDC059718]
MAMMRDDFWVMVEFFRGRLREDETLARTVKVGKDEGLTRLRDQVLADVEAKRRILDWVLKEEAPEDRSGVFWEDALMKGLTGIRRGLRAPVLRELVQAYAKHPDFRREWLLIDGKRELEDGYEPDEDRPSTRTRG